MNKSVDVENPCGNSKPKGKRKMAAKKKATKKKATTKRKKNPAKKKPRRRRRKKNPMMHPVLAAGLGGAIGGGAGVGTIAALRYYSISEPKMRGWGMIIGGIVVGVPVAFLSAPFGAGLAAGMIGAGGAELTTGITPKDKKKAEEKKEPTGPGQLTPRSHPRFGPRDAADVAATRAARRLSGRGADISAVVADDIGRSHISAVVADTTAGATRVGGLGVGMVVDSMGRMYVDESLARRMTTR